jgi:hypothetical protein
MKLSDLKWWHWTLATIAVAALIRVATGGPLPFMAPTPAQTEKAAAQQAGRPERKANTGPSIIDSIKAPGMKVSAAVPERDRLTLEATVDNPGNGVGLVDNTGALVTQIAKALQAGVSEDSTAVTQVRILVATKGTDRTGRDVAHLSLYSLTYKASDLFQLKPTATPAQALAPAVNVIFNLEDSHKAMHDWCGAADHLNQALAFCGLVTSSKGV